MRFCLTDSGFFFDSLLYNVIEVVQFSVEVVVIQTYLYPSLFLAVDRFIAVAFPHKVLDLSRKVRPIKWGLFVLNVLVVSVLAVLQFVEFPGSVIVNSILRPVRLLLLGIQLFGPFSLYMAMTVLLIRSNKTIGHAMHR